MATDMCFKGQKRDSCASAVLQQEGLQSVGCFSGRRDSNPLPPHQHRQFFPASSQWRSHETSRARHYIEHWWCPGFVSRPWLAAFSLKRTSGIYVQNPAPHTVCSTPFRNAMFSLRPPASPFHYCCGAHILRLFALVRQKALMKDGSNQC